MIPFSRTEIDLSLYPSGTTVDGDGRLTVAGCAVSEIAEQYGTPAYVLDEGALRARAREYRAAFESLHPRSLVLFAAKSFPSAAVIGAIAEEGCGTDTAGEGELRLALAGGQDPQLMVAHGNAKTDADVRSAIDAGIRYIVIDNADDIRRIAQFATAPVPVLLRVIPDLDAHTHAAMMTGHTTSKFGVPAGAVPGMIAAIEREPMIELRGLHVHIGSQLTELDQFERAVEAIAGFGNFDVYDLGGGLGVRYVSRDTAPSVEEYAERLVTAAHRHLGRDVELLVEPGRSLVAQSMLTCYRVVTVKRGERVHVAVDGGMSDTLEVSLYGQEFAPSLIDREGPSELADIVGRHCESGDYLANDVRMPRAEVGDLVTVPMTGAYCYTMANNYNGALRPPVVFCHDGQTRLAVRRETFDDLLRREQFIGAH